MSWRWPFDPTFASMEFGPRINPVTGRSENHNGIDFGARSGAWAGAPILAPADGVVHSKLSYNWNTRTPLGGNQVRLTHAPQGGTSVHTRYLHMLNPSALSVGAQVRKGDVIGYVGNTGQSTGTHLHWEVLLGGRAVNPRVFMASASGGGEKPFEPETPEKEEEHDMYVLAHARPGQTTHIYMVGPRRLHHIGNQTDLARAKAVFPYKELDDGAFRVALIAYNIPYSVAVPQANYNGDWPTAGLTPAQVDSLATSISSKLAPSTGGATPAQVEAIVKNELKALTLKSA